MDVSRFTDTIFTGSTSNQKTIVGAEKKSPTYDEIVTGSADKKADTPAQSESRLSSSISDYDPPAPAPITKSGWTTAGGTRVTVRDGDTVSSMSRRYGVPKTAILASNPNIGPSGHLQTGQKVIIPTYVHSEQAAPVVASPAPVQRDDIGDKIITGSVPSTTAQAPASQPYPGDRAATAPLPAAKPYRTAYAPVARAQPSNSGFYTVQSGDTVSSIASRNSVSRADLIEANGLNDGNVIKIGQKLKIPSAKSATTRVVAERSVAPEPQRQTEQKIAAATPTPKPTVNRRVASAPSDVDPITTGSIPPAVAQPKPERNAVTQPTTPNSRSFRWPVRGRVISEFGPKPNGQHNDGINLAVPEGTSVKAAEDGIVIYSGNELKGYGSLVLVRHSDGWVTAYAHNSTLMVKRGDSVRRGQVIAKAGATGSVDQPQVHFELRRGSRPVDPLPYLAGA